MGRFSDPPIRVMASSRSNRDEVYSLSGLNMVTPDQIIDTATRRYNKKMLGQTPYTINSRMFSRDDAEERTAIRTRKGGQFLFGLDQSADTPITVQHNDAITGELMLSSAQQIVSPIVVPSYSLSFGYYCISQLSLQIRKTSGTIESIIIELATDTTGKETSVIATSSFDLSTVTLVSQTIKARFIDAPKVTSGQTLYMWLKLVGSTTAEAYVKVSSTAGASTRDLSTAGASLVATGKTVWFTAPSYRSGSIISAFRRVVLGETAKTLVQTGYGDLLWYDNSGNTGVIGAYANGYEPFASRMAFCQQDNLTFFVNKDIQPSYWDGTAVHTLSNAPFGAEDIFVWKNRLFVRVGGRFAFTDILTTLTNDNVWPSVDFFYPSTPKDPDGVVGSVVFKDSLVIFTHETKYTALIYGTGIASLTIQEVNGTRGALSQSVLATDDDYIYFIADDRRMYRFNGVTDDLVSDDVDPEIRASLNAATTASIFIYNNQVRYYFAKSPSAEVNRCLIFDTNYGEWFLDTGRPVAFAIEHTLEDNRLVEFSSKTTLAMLGNTGYSDMGKPIDFKYWTPYKAYASGAAKDRVRRFRPILKVESRSFTMQIGKDIDFTNRPDMRDYLVSGGGVTFGGGAKYGDGSVYSGVRMVDRAAGVSGRGKHTQYRFEKNGVNTPVMIYGYISLYKTGKDK